MKGKVRLKTITLFLMITGACGDFLDELKVSLDKLQNTVDEISLEQIKTNKKVDQLQEKISLEQRKTNKKVDNLEEKIAKLGSKVITVEDLNEVNNNISDAIDQLKDEMKTSLEKFSEYGCNEPETNVPNLANGNKDETNLTEDHINALNHAKEVERWKGKNINCLPI